MDTATFNKIVDSRIDKIRTTLQSVDHALIGMMVKHVVSVLDIAEEWESKKVSIDMIDEKIGDTINYLILLEAMLREDIDETYIPKKFISAVTNEAASIESESIKLGSEKSK